MKDRNCEIQECEGCYRLVGLLESDPKFTLIDGVARWRDIGYKNPIPIATVKEAGIDLMPEFDEQKHLAAYREFIQEAAERFSLERRPHFPKFPSDDS